MSKLSKYLLILWALNMSHKKFKLKYCPKKQIILFEMKRVYSSLLVQYTIYWK